MSKKRRGSSVVLDPFSDYEHAPKAGLPEHPNVRNRRWLRGYTWVATFGFLPAIVIGTAAQMATAASISDLTTQAASDALDSDESRARGVAMSAVATWLDSDPQPLPGASVLSWEAAAVNLPPEDSTDPAVQVHSVILSAPTGADGTALYSATVPVAVTDSGPIAMSTPSLMPLPPTGQDSSTITLWPGAKEADASPELISAVQAWAGAYTSGDPNALRLAVGDPESGHSYMPLPPTPVEGVNLGSTALPAGAKVDDQGRASSVVANVTINLERKEETAPVSYDVLVQDANTASPRVVAWGPAGSGMSLAPYSNALTNVTLAVQQPAPEPTEEAQAPPAPAPPQPAEVPAAPPEAPPADTFTFEEGQ